MYDLGVREMTKFEKHRVKVSTSQHESAQLLFGSFRSSRLFFKFRNSLSHVVQRNVPSTPSC